MGRWAKRLSIVINQIWHGNGVTWKWVPKREWFPLNHLVILTPPPLPPWLTHICMSNDLMYPFFHLSSRPSIADIVIAVGNEFNPASGSGLQPVFVQNMWVLPRTGAISCNSDNYVYREIAGRYAAVLLKDDTPTNLAICEFEVYGRGRGYHVFFVCYLHFLTFNSFHGDWSLLV